MGYTFNAPLLLRQALTHTSYVHEEGLKANKSNERLEFLGDAVLELCISDMLYRRFLNQPEGKLTMRRAGLVCEPTLAGIARRLRLGDALFMGHGASQTGGRNLDSILSDAMEALFGAIFLDGGHQAASRVIEKLYAPLINNVISPPKDYKSALQHLLQKNSRETAKYTIIGDDGPSHNKEFTAEVLHMSKVIGVGCGHSKKDAEQNAAYAALKGLGVKPV